MDSSICGMCTAPSQPPPTIQLRYPPVVSESLVGESETPGSVCKMSPVEEPCSIKQVSPTHLSSDIYEPASAPRVTQTSIGKFLVPDETPEGGSGNSGSGIKGRNRDELDARVLDDYADKDKAWWVDKPGKNAPFLHCIQKEFTQPQPFDPYFSHKSKFVMFPRPKEYELSSIIARRNTCQDDGITDNLLCNCGPSNTCCPQKYCQKQLARCQTPYWWHDVPYWWYGDGDRTHLPVGSPDDYSYLRLRDEELKGHVPFNLINTLLLDRAERYIPGQIYCDERHKIQGIGRYKYDKCHPPPPPLTAEQISDKAMAEERATCVDRPYSNPKRHPETHEASISRRENTVGCNPNDEACPVCTEIMKRRLQLCDQQNAQQEEQRKQEVLRVGQPFRSAACKLHHQLYPPQKAMQVRTSMKYFPHTRVTNL